MMKLSKNVRKSRKGQSLVEYGLILALVSVVAIVVLTQMGGQIKNIIDKVNVQLETAANQASGG
ncbi:MAG: Flp family type IVb pilin [Candidatus Gastranaerophilales bacterium]|nr:Flp family type IVb pilin [Candidatus Gastranaerophilales bacterium]